MDVDERPAGRLDLGRHLDPEEERVLGVLLEKELSSPDVYPLTVNALVAGSNQTTNREPVMRLGEAAVEAALGRLMAMVVVWRERGARTLRWRHDLAAKAGLAPPTQAVLAELLLRGPQTPGELRSRTARMHAFGDLGEVEATLAELAAGGLVVELERAPGQKERRWAQLLGEPSTEAAAARVGRGSLVAAPAEPPAAPRAPAAQVAADEGLAARVARLERTVADLAARLGRLEEG